MTLPLTQLDPTEPGVWLLGSLLVAILVSNVAWLLARWLATGPRGTRFLRWSGLPALTWLPVALYLLVPPFAAWRFGAISLFTLGLAEVNWLESLAAGGLLIALVIGLAGIGRLVYLRSGPDPTGLQRVGTIATWRVPLDAALAGWHWAFYRAAAIGWLATAGAPALAAVGQSLPVAAALLQPLTDQPLYWGSWLGLALVAVEWIANPFGRADLRTPGRSEPALGRAAVAVATTALFSLTRNLWLCLACQVAAEIVMTAGGQRAADATKGE